MPSIDIQAHAFQTPDRYSAGHTLTEVEAKVLNHALGAGIRNNFARHVREAIKSHFGVENTEDLGDERLPTATMNILQAQLDDFASGYTFAAPLGPRQVSIEAEAKKLALREVRRALIKNGKRPKDHTPEQLELLASDLLRRYPVITENARAIAAAKKLDLNSIAAE
jgi:hypothetical protein